jgi:hypothetical protein
MNLKCRVCSLQRGIFHCDIEYSLEGKLIKGVCRYYYHAALEKTCPVSWEHYEMHAFDGSLPIMCCSKQNPPVSNRRVL